MTGWNDSDREYTEVDAALRVLPQAPVPPALASNIMSAVRAGAAPTHARRTLVRYGLLLLLTEALIVVVLAARYLPPGFGLYFKIELDFWFLRLQSDPSFLPLMKGVAMLAAGLVMVAFALLNWRRTGTRE